MTDHDDLSRYMGRRPYRRKRVSSGETAGLPSTDMPRERIHCIGCRKFRRYKDVYSVFEFGPGIAWRMRVCKFCGTVVQEKTFDLTGKEKMWSAIDVITKLK
jgi:hypothetical protein